MNKHLCLLALLALSACGTSPDPDYYTLTSVDGPRQMQTEPMTIKLRRPGLPATLDRPEMVSTSGNNVSYSDNHLWSEPLDRMIERVLADDLGKRLPNSAVITESGGMVVEPDAIIDLEIQKFGANENGRPELAAIVSVYQGEIARAPQRIVLQGEGGSMPASFSQLLGQLADRIAISLDQGHR